MCYGRTMSAHESNLDELLRLHAAVDAEATTLAERHGERLRCALGCTDCCVDDITVFTIEAALIARHHASLLAEGKPHPAGACAFLDSEGACRIYDRRPYVCRTQGLPLRWIETDATGAEATREYRDICPLNEPGPSLLELDAESFWEIGPREAELASLQSRHSGKLERRSLRGLFATLDADA